MSDTDTIPTMVVRPKPAQDGQGGTKPGATEWDGRKLSYGDMVNRWKARGYSDAGARGIADNMTRESGGNPTAIGPGGAAIGLFQHEGPRRAALEKFAKERGTSATDPDTQIDFADRELRTQYPKLREQLVSGTDRGAAENQFKRLFERPKSVLWENNPRLASDSYRFSDYAMNEHAGRKNTDVVYMKPQDYLDLAPDLEEKPFTSPAGRSLLASVDKGEPIEAIPTLGMKVKGNSGEITEQDGRHRALLAQHAGLDAIPVAITKTGKGDPTEIEGMSGKILPNNFAKAADVKKPDQSLWSRAAQAISPIGRAEAAEPQAGGIARTERPSDDGWEPVPEQPSPAEQGQSAAAPGQDGWEPVPTQPPPEEQQTEPKPESDKYAGWDTALPPEPPVPLRDDPNKTYGTLLPLAADKRTGAREWAVPGFLRAPIRGMVEGGQEALGERPAGDPRVSGDLAAAASFGVGAPPAAIIRSVTQRGGAGEFRPMYEFVSRIVGGDISKNDAALRIVARMEQDAKAGGPTAQDMLDIMNATPDKPLVLGDVVGENALAYLGRLSRKPGEGRQVVTKGLNDRDMGAGSRLAGDVDRSIASGSVDEVGEALAKARKAASQPAYDAAHAAPPINPDEMQPNGSIGVMMNRPSFRAGMKNARKISAEEGVDMMTLGIDLDAQGEPFFTAVPTWKTLDYVKRGMDDVIEGFRSDTTGKLMLDSYGNAAQQTRTAYRDILRQLNPLYGKALDAYSGPSASLDAIRAGQDFLRLRPAEIERRIAGLSPGDKEFYKLGAADTIRTALAKKGVGADEAKAIIHSQWMRDQLRPLFDNNDAYERFIKSAEAEGRMFGTRYSALGNSRTAAREAEDASPEVAAAAHAARGVGAAMSHNPLSALWHAIRAGEAMNSLRNPAIEAEAARLMMSPLNHPDTRGRLNALKDFMSMLPTTRSYLSRYAGPSSRFMAPVGMAGANALAGSGGALPSMKIRPGDAGQ